MNVFLRHDLVQRAHELRKGSTIIGLDHGSKTLGVAVSDTLWMTATALGTIQRKKFGADMQQLHQMMQGRDIGGVILGLPREMSGALGSRAQAVADFASHLENYLGCCCLLWEERLTSAEAERAMLQADLSRKKRAQKIDNHAAAIILQSALDRIMYL
ncbi:MAG: Holliday junction resolvase RuvX [Alphaproteobacteria bacterium]